MKKTTLFLCCLAIAINVLAQENKFHFGSFTNISYCGTKDEFSSNALPTMGYQFGFISRYSLDKINQIQFGMGLSETGLVTKREGKEIGEPEIKSIKRKFVSQDIIFPIAYKHNFRSNNQFYWLGGFSLLIKYDRLARTKTVFTNNSIVKSTSAVFFETSRILNMNFCLGLGYESKIFKHSTLYVQPLFEINIAPQNGPNDFITFQEFSGRFYTLGLTMGLIMD